MARKFVTVMRPKRYHKEYREHTETVLEGTGFHNRNGIHSEITLSTLNDETPDWDDFYLITIEKLPPCIGHCSDNYKDTIEKAMMGVQEKPTNGRKFRD